MMNCEWVKQNVLLYLYNELPDDARYELEQHVNRCGECAGELKAVREFHHELAQHPVEEPSPNLLAASRMRLQESLETAEQGGFWQRVTFDPAAWLRPLRLSPALTAMIFVFGFAAGVGSTYKLVKAEPTELNAAEAPAMESSITGIRSVAQQPGSNQISIKYDTVSTQEAQGSLNDQRIQQLLLFAARNNYNSGVRIDSVDLLTRRPEDVQVREALVYALRYDSNPGVRLKAVAALAPYVKDDLRVRDAELEALMNDANSGVRTQALHALEPVAADGSVRAVLGQLAERDANLYIRSQARLVLAQMPEMD